MSRREAVTWGAVKLDGPGEWCRVRIARRRDANPGGPWSRYGAWRPRPIAH
jgi:hypothetical protein